MARRKPKPTPDPSIGSSESHRPPVTPPAQDTPADTIRPADRAADRTAASAEPDPPAAVARPDGPRAPNPFGFRTDTIAGVRLLEDRRFKQVQLKFAERPSDAVREAVRDAGFRWLQEEQVWARQIDPERGWQTRADAEALFARVAAMIRSERGVTRDHP